MAIYSLRVRSQAQCSCEKRFGDHAAYSPHPKKLIDAIVSWARLEEDIVGVALVGSWARGNPNKRSDIDFMMLTDAYLSRIGSVQWSKNLCHHFLRSRLKRWRIGFYGAVWSRHILLTSGQKIELSFGPLSWASTSPIDSGTRYVVHDALQVLYDPLGILANLKAQAVA
jgi:uncharacterized protein